MERIFILIRNGFRKLHRVMFPSDYRLNLTNKSERAVFKKVRD